MTLEDFCHTSGEWLRGTGPESDIVMCSRIRLARNLADFAFTNRASRSEKTEIERTVRAALEKLGLELSYFSLADLGPLERQLLVERQLVSRELAAGEGPVARVARRRSLCATRAVRGYRQCPSNKCRTPWCAPRAVFRQPSASHPDCA